MRIVQLLIAESLEMIFLAPDNKISRHYSWENQILHAWENLILRGGSILADSTCIRPWLQRIK